MVPRFVAGAVQLNENANGLVPAPPLVLCVMFTLPLPAVTNFIFVVFVTTIVPALALDEVSASNPNPNNANPVFATVTLIA